MKFLFIKKRRRKISRKSQAHYLENKELSRKVITQRVEHYAAAHGFKYNKIAIKNTTSRWGSCSSNRNLNFNYKLAFLDKGLLDYVVVHELCHLREMNHGKQFWMHVEYILPQYKNCIKQFRSISISKVIV